MANKIYEQFAVSGETITRYVQILTVCLIISRAQSCAFGFNADCLYWRVEDIMPDKCYNGSNATNIFTSSAKNCALACMTSKNGNCIVATFKPSNKECQLFNGVFASWNVVESCSGFQLIVLHGTRGVSHHVLLFNICFLFVVEYCEKNIMENNVTSET